MNNAQWEPRDQLRLKCLTGTALNTLAAAFLVEHNPLRLTGLPSQQCFLP